MHCQSWRINFITVVAKVQKYGLNFEGSWSKSTTEFKNSNAVKPTTITCLFNLRGKLWCKIDEYLQLSLSQPILINASTKTMSEYTDLANTTPWPVTETNTTSYKQLFTFNNTATD